MYNQKNNEITKFTIDIFSDNTMNYGFKSSDDLMQELRSPIQSVNKQFLQNRIIDKVIELENIKTNKHLKHIQDKLLKKQKALLQVLARQKAKEKKEKIIAFNEEYNAWILESEAEYIKERVERRQNSVKGRYDSYISAYKDIAQAYLDQYNVLQEIYNDKEAEYKVVMYDSDRSQRQYAEYDKQYNLIEQQILNQIPNITNILEKVSSNTKEFIDSQKELIEKTQANILKRMTGLESLINKDTEIVAHLLDAGDDEEAKRLVEIQNARNAQLGFLYGILGTLNGSHVFLDANCNVTGQFDNAAFIVDKNQPVESILNPSDGTTKQVTMSDKRVALYNNDYYLVNKNENVEDLTPELQAKARADFLKQEAKLSTVKELINENKKRSSLFFKSREEQISNELKEISQELKFLLKAQERATEIATNVEDGTMKPKLKSMLNPAEVNLKLNPPTPASIKSKALIASVKGIKAGIFPNKSNTLPDPNNQQDKGYVLDDKAISNLKKFRDESSKHINQRKKNDKAFQESAEARRKFFEETGSLIAGQPVPTNKMARILEGLNRFMADGKFDGLLGMTQKEELREASTEIKQMKKDISTEIKQEKKDFAKENLLELRSIAEENAQKIENTQENQSSAILNPFDINFRPDPYKQ